MDDSLTALLDKLLQGRFDEALTLPRGEASAEALRLLAARLAEAAAYVSALAAGNTAEQQGRPFPRQAGTPPDGPLPPVPRPTASTAHPPRPDEDDPETGLPTRRAFLWRVRDMIEAQPRSVGVLCSIGLDNLRYVNEVHGYACGDKYLAKVAAVLRRLEGPSVLAARPAGDEFAVFAHGFEETEAALHFAQDVRKRLLQTTLDFVDDSIHIRTSLGAAAYPADGHTSDQLLNHATYAMYGVQNGNRGTFQRFNPEIYRAKAAHVAREERLAELLERRLIRFAFQPVVSLRDGTIFGYEALMRSTQPQFASPLDILELAEAQYKLPQLEVMTFKVILEWLVRHQDDLGARKIFFNAISADYLDEGEMRALHPSYARIAGNLVIEITETATIEGAMTKRINEFRGRSPALIAIDDFGCAHSNIFRLMNLSPDILKVDRFFISGIQEAAPSRRELVADVLRYCKSRGILTVAEGVETSEELECVARMGFDLCQGYHLARPDFALCELTLEQVAEVRRCSAPQGGQAVASCLPGLP